MKSISKKIYIVRGGPASGKTTLTPLLASHLSQPVALLEQDRWRWDIHVVGRKISEVDAREHVFADTLFLKTLESYLVQGQYTIIVEGSFGWQPSSITHLSASAIKKLAEQHGYSVTNLVLQADIAVQQTRNRARKYTVPSKEFHEIYDVIYNYCDPSEAIIDSSDQKLETTLKKILNELDIKS